MFQWLCRWWAARKWGRVGEEELSVGRQVKERDILDVMNQEYAELVEGIFGRPLSSAGAGAGTYASENIVYDAVTHTRIKSLRQSIGEELERRLSVPDPDSNAEEKRRSWRFQSIDSEYRLQLFHGYIDDVVKVEPTLLRDPSVVRLLNLDIIG
jgi:hypothetical protein